ncbi:thioredoxin [Lachnobacterium bovis]|uniref:Thioredoxin n=1 Tax=Lachnobacterium bovis DSM 14045 TaxID=1122142 RepID=A0A1H3JDI4_9FIRM|nr:thioredoxin [Lachnobacterium bovis]SDY37595.1 thioredoxin [Lachnobacterium bovis DSM 14045]
MSEVILTKDNFNKEVLESDIPVLVDFWASWCGPCKMISPVISEIAEEYAGKVKVGKINVDEQPDLSAQFNIVSIPTLLVFKNGRIANSSVGLIPKDAIVKLFD